MLKKLFLYYPEYVYELLKPKNYTKKSITRNNETKVLIRVDDFPHWTKSFADFKKFDKIMKKYCITYILAVTPKIAKNPKSISNNKYRELTKSEMEFLKRGEIENRITIAMHGLTHQTTSNKKFSEYIGKDNKEIEKEIKLGLKLFKK